MSSTTRISFVLHRAAALSAEDRFAGSTDVARSDEGCRRTARLVERLGPEARLSKWWDAGEGASDARRV